MKESWGSGKSVLDRCRDRGEKETPRSGARAGGSRAAATLSAILVTAAAAAAHATTINVNTTDTGFPGGTCGGVACCGIRQAIQAVNTHLAVGGCAAGNGSNDTINLIGGTYTATSSLTITQPLFLHGSGVGVTILRGNMTSNSEFLVAQPVSTGAIVQIDNLTVDRTGGTAFVTGIRATNATLQFFRSRIAGFTKSGIIANDTDLKMEDVSIESNSTQTNGGGIQFNNPAWPSRNSGIFANRCTIASNNASGLGGGLYYLGHGVTNLWNFTIASNSAGNLGGGVYQDPSTDYLFFYGSTIANNTAANSGGGVEARFGIKLFESILGQNSAHTNPDIDGSVNTCENSLISQSLGLTQLVDLQMTCAPLLDVWPDLDTVARDLGSPYHVKVVCPFPGSVVIDLFPGPFDVPPGPPFDVTPTDGKKVKRPQFGGSLSSNGDIGACESSRLETEALTVAAKSSDTHVIVSASQYSHGQGTNLQSGAINDFVTYSTSGSIPAGTYNITVGFKKGSNAGQFQLARASAVGGTYTNVGGVQDGFASTDTWVTVNFGNVTVSTTSTKFFRFLVTGKNASSSGFQVFPDFIDFTRQ
jgi:hypothetical protein